MKREEEDLGLSSGGRASVKKLEEKKDPQRRERSWPVLNPSSWRWGKAQDCCSVGHALIAVLCSFRGA